MTVSYEPCTLNQNADTTINNTTIHQGDHYADSAKKFNGRMVKAQINSEASERRIEKSSTPENSSAQKSDTRLPQRQVDSVTANLAMEETIDNINKKCLEKKRAIIDLKNHCGSELEIDEKYHEMINSFLSSYKKDGSQTDNATTYLKLATYYTSKITTPNLNEQANKEINQLSLEAIEAGILYKNSEDTKKSEKTFNLLNKFMALVNILESQGDKAGTIKKQLKNCLDELFQLATSTVEIKINTKTKDKPSASTVSEIEENKEQKLQLQMLKQLSNTQTFFGTPPPQPLPPKEIYITNQKKSDFLSKIESFLKTFENPKSTKTDKDLALKNLAIDELFRFNSFDRVFQKQITSASSKQNPDIALAELNYTQQQLNNMDRLYTLGGNLDILIEQCTIQIYTINLKIIKSSELISESLFSRKEKVDMLDFMVKQGKQFSSPSRDDLKLLEDIEKTYTAYKKEVSLVSTSRFSYLNTQALGFPSTMAVLAGDSTAIFTRRRVNGVFIPFIH